jgi:hypothetical protein
MDCVYSSSPENEIQFLLSLLRISNPGEPASEQSQSIEELLWTETNG